MNGEEYFLESHEYAYEGINNGSSFWVGAASVNGCFGTWEAVWKLVFGVRVAAS